MKKQLVCLFLVCVMLLLCGCNTVSGKTEVPDSDKETARPEAETRQESVTRPVSAEEVTVPSKDDGGQRPVTRPASTKEDAPAATDTAQESAAKVEGAGYSSPEEAILAYANALQQGDVQRILSTFAIETYVEHYDLAAAMKNTGSYTFSSIPLLPNADAYTKELNQGLWQGAIVKNLAYMYLTLGDVAYTGAPILFNGNPYDTPDQLVDALTIQNWIQTLSDMEIGAVLTFEDLFQDSERVSQSLKNQQQNLGCEELVPLAVEITLDGQSYYLCTDVACYDGKWYNCKYFGTIAVLSGADLMSGGLCPLED